MTEELQAKIWDLLDMVRTKQLPVNVAHANLLKIMEEYKERKGKNAKNDLYDQITLMLQNSVAAELLMRNGWGYEMVCDELKIFLETNYYEGGEIDNVYRHFMNWIRKRKPNEENQRNKPATTEQIAGTYANKFAKGNNESR